MSITVGRNTGISLVDAEPKKGVCASEVVLDWEPNTSAKDDQTKNTKFQLLPNTEASKAQFHKAVKQKILLSKFLEWVWHHLQQWNCYGILAGNQQDLPVLSNFSCLKGFMNLLLKKTHCFTMILRKNEVISFILIFRSPLGLHFWLGPKAKQKNQGFTQCLTLFRNKFSKQPQTQRLWASQTWFCFLRKLVSEKLHWLRPSETYASNLVKFLNSRKESYFWTPLKKGPMQIAQVLNISRTKTLTKV